jgi:hypothetical protein
VAFVGMVGFLAVLKHFNRRLQRIVTRPIP